MKKVTLKGFIQVPENDLSAVEQALGLHIELTRQEPGCLVSKVERNESSQYRFNVYEEFENKAAFDAHQQRTAHSQWAKVTKNVERHYTIIE